MIKVRVKIFPTVDKREGVNDNGKPWEMIGQQAQIDGGNDAPSLPFEIRLKHENEAFKAGLYDGVLVARAGRFRNSIEWNFSKFHPVA